MRLMVREVSSSGLLLLFILCSDIQEYLLLKGVEAVAIHGSKSKIAYACSRTSRSDKYNQLRKNVSTQSNPSSPVQRTSW